MSFLTTLIIGFGLIIVISEVGLAHSNSIFKIPQKNRTKWHKLGRILNYMKWLDEDRFLIHPDGQQVDQRALLGRSDIRSVECGGDGEAELICEHRVGSCVGGIFRCECEYLPDKPKSTWAAYEDTMPYGYSLLNNKRVTYCFSGYAQPPVAFTMEGAMGLKEQPDMDPFHKACSEQCEKMNLMPYYCHNVLRNVPWLDVNEYCVCACLGTGAGRYGSGHGSITKGPGRLSYGRDSFYYFQRIY